MKASKIEQNGAKNMLSNTNEQNLSHYKTHTNTHTPKRSAASNEGITLTLYAVTISSRMFPESDSSIPTVAPGMRFA